MPIGPFSPPWHARTRTGECNNAACGGGCNPDSDHSDSGYVWVQVDCGLDRDATIQPFINVMTGDQVMGRTSGSFSDHVHLYVPGTGGTWVDSNVNLDPSTGEVSKNGNLLQFIVATVTSAASAFATGGLTAADTIGLVGSDVSGGIVASRSQPASLPPNALIVSSPSSTAAALQAELPMILLAMGIVIIILLSTKK